MDVYDEKVVGDIELLGGVVGGKIGRKVQVFGRCTDPIDYELDKMFPAGNI